MSMRNAAGGGQQRFGRDEDRYDDYYARNRAAGRGRNDWDRNQDRGFFRNDDRRDARVGDHAQIAAAYHQAQQTQAVLAALQAPANLQPNFMQNRGPVGGFQDRNDRRGGMGGARGRGAPRPGEKRRTDTSYTNYGKQRDRRPLPAKTTTTSAKARESEKEKPKEKTEKDEVVIIDEPDIPDEDVEIPDSLMDGVEKLRQRGNAERNTADEDTEKLTIFCYTGKGYKCDTCGGTFFSKETAFKEHLKQKSHVMKVIDARGDNDGAKYKIVRDILDIKLDDDSWLENSELAQGLLRGQAKMLMRASREVEAREKLNYNKNPANFFRCEYSARKTALKKEEQIVFSHLFETTMFVSEFAGDRFFGCEFVKAECGFNCRLCNLYIKDANNVVGHIDSRSHRQQYQNFLKKNPDYEKKQKKQNLELAEALAQEENKYVVLNETKRPGEKVFLDHAEQMCVRIPDLLVSKEEEEAKKKKEEEEKAAQEAKEAEEKKKAEEEAAATAAAAEAEKKAEAEAEKDKADEDVVEVESTDAAEKPAADAEEVKDDKEKEADSTEPAPKKAKGGATRGGRKAAAPRASTGRAKRGAAADGSEFEVVDEVVEE